MNYSIASIEEMIEKKEIAAELIPAVVILLAAVNDWPDPLDGLRDYEIAVQCFVGDTTTRDNIEKALNNIDVSSCAWEAESLSTLMEVYDYFEEGIALKEIVDRVVAEKRSLCRDKEVKDVLWFKEKVAPILVGYEVSYRYVAEGDFGSLDLVEFNSSKRGGEIDFWSTGWLSILLVDYSNSEVLLNLFLEPDEDNEKEQALEMLLVYLREDK